MAGNVKFEDYSIEIIGELNEATKAALHEIAGEIVSHAQRNASTEGWTSSERTQLRDSYAANEENIDDGIVQVGTPLEQGFWEEFGTGSHAATGKNGGKPGRPGWWIYTPGHTSPSGKKSRTYATEEEAEEMAEYIRKEYGKTAIVTNGREPSYTLENAYIANRAFAEKKTAEILKERLDE